MNEIDHLARRFDVPGHVRFRPGAGPFPVAEIANAAATATVTTYGAHVLTYQPRGQPPVLWISPNAVFKPGKAIRGGIPVCWPWFGQSGGAPGLPAHGFVRTRVWDVEETRAEGPDRTVIRLGLRDDPQTRALFWGLFRATLSITVGNTLDVELSICNLGVTPLLYTAALHTYFAVSDVRLISLAGLEHVPYVSTVGGVSRPCRQGGTPIRFAEETDRIYVATTHACTIFDPAWSRSIVVTKRGSHSTVVWNPWLDKAASMPDLGGAHFPAFVCLETANCGTDVVSVPPGSTRVLATHIASGRT